MQAHHPRPARGLTSLLGRNTSSVIHFLRLASRPYMTLPWPRHLEPRERHKVGQNADGLPGRHGCVHHQQAGARSLASHCARRRATHLQERANSASALWQDTQPARALPVLWYQLDIHPWTKPQAVHCSSCCALHGCVCTPSGFSNQASWRNNESFCWTTTAQ